MPKARIALYPGSFDPLTMGHVNVVERALHLFDRLVVAVARNGAKQALFKPDERAEMLREVFRDCSRVEVVTFEGLLVHFARRIGADSLVRGLRAVSDFDYEFQLALMNRRLAPDIETVFLMTDADKSFLSSSTVKEVARLGGSVHGLVPDIVEERLVRKLRSATT